MRHKFNPTLKKLVILSFLKEPKTRDEIAKKVGWYKLNYLMADLVASGLILYNQSTKKIERVDVELVIL